MKVKHIILSLCSLISYTLFAQTPHPKVKVVGAMSNVMRKGQLYGTIYLDTLTHKKNLYGLGPKEFLKGEILIVDGKSYVSSISENGEIKVEQTFDVKAPFFVYAPVTDWKAYKLPNGIKTLKQLEEFIDKKSKNKQRPFAFKLQGVFKKVAFHIQNLPEGVEVKSPKDAHTGQGKYERNVVNGTIIGFFSTQHQTIFTHHDTYIHMHYIDDKNLEMGHVDDLLLGDHVILYLPVY